MADISTITVLDGTTYNLKDATARAALVVATSTSNGLMSAQDKTNLDTLVAGGGSGGSFTPMTEQEIWTAASQGWGTNVVMTTAQIQNAVDNGWR